MPKKLDESFAKALPAVNLPDSFWRRDKMQGKVMKV